MINIYISVDDKYIYIYIYIYISVDDLSVDGLSDRGVEHVWFLD